MSTELAIASVTHVLKDLLNNGLIDRDITGAIGGNVTVTALPPDRVDITVANQQSQLNLFMYQVTYNQSWRNVGLPSHSGGGERLSNPPLALDLHYLLTAYGADELHAEILLGYGMQLMHETPVLARDAVRRALAPPLTAPGGGLPDELKALSTSELAEQIEQIKVIPASLSTEEISKLWSAFQAKYRPTMAYQASVVLIESRRSTRSALPVRGRKVYVIPFQQPVIEQIKSQKMAGTPIVADQPILAGYNLVIVGRQLQDEETSISVGGIEVTPSFKDMSETQIIVPLPAGLSAGVQGVQVIHQTLMGSPPAPHRGVESNLAAFVLQPQLKAINVSNMQATGNDLYSGDVNVTVEPAVGTAQRVVLLLNELSQAPASPPVSDGSTLAAYSFYAPAITLLSPPMSPPGAIENLTIPINNVRAGTYLARIRVDGAESPLLTDEAGRYNAPQVSIP
jgi:hypothetical protein